MNKMLYLTRVGGALQCATVCVMWCADLSPLIDQAKNYHSD